MITLIFTLSCFVCIYFMTKFKRKATLNDDNYDHYYTVHYDVYCCYDFIVLLKAKEKN